MIAEIVTGHNMTSIRIDCLLNCRRFCILVTGHYSLSKMMGSVMRRTSKLVVFAGALALALMAGTSVTSASTNRTDEEGANFTGSWSVQSTSDPASDFYAPAPYGANSDDFRLSESSGSAVSFTFTGNSISVIGSYASNFGKADVSIDGGAATTIDLYIKPYEFEASDGTYYNYKHNRAIYVMDGLADGTHTITITVKGQKDPASSGFGVAIDSFIARDTNRAKNATVTASSSLEGSYWAKSNVVDGQTGSTTTSLGWTSDGNLTTNHTEWLQADLGETNFVDRVDLFPRSDVGSVGAYFPIDFTIALSNDGTTWTTVVSRAGYPTPSDTAQTFRFGAQTARYVKITGTNLRQNPDESNRYRMQFAEIVVAYDSYQHSSTLTAIPDTTYYVSTSGNDSNNGTSASTPWRTLQKVSQYAYSGGNSILLKRGDSWTGETLYLHGNGTAENAILVSAYGSGNKPVISANMGEAIASIKIVNNHGIRIAGLELTGGAFGIEVLNDATHGHDYLYLDDLYIHDVEGRSIGTDLVFPYPESYFGAAILISSLMTDENQDQTVFSNITLTNSVISQTDTGFINLVRDKPYDYTGLPTNAWNSDRDAYTNVNITNTQIYRSYRSGGIMMYATTGGVTDNVVIDETGYLKGMFWGVAAFQIANSENYTVQNSEFMRTYKSNQSPDGEGFDFEAGNRNVTLTNSYIHDNAGPSILLYGENGGWFLNNTGLIINNVFAYRNGTEGAGFDSKAIKNYPRNEGIIQNSVFIRKFAGQDVTSDPVAFESSNYIANPDLSQAFGPGRTKWALGASVIASSNVNDYGWTLANVVDGIWSSKAGAAGTVNGWSSNSNLGADHTEWIQIDLGQSRTISEVDLWASDRDTIYFPKDFDIQISVDGASWTTVASRTNYAQPTSTSPKQAFTFAAQSARYVKVTATSLRSNPLESNNYRMQFAEIDVLQLH